MILFSFIGNLLFLTISISFALFLPVILLISLAFIILSIFLRLSLKKQKSDDSRLSVAFFHPYCDDGGGGERVLWCSLRALQNKYPQYRYLVYTGDVNSEPSKILDKAKSAFNISLPQPVEFIYLNKRSWVEASRYPHFTLIGQSLGSLVLGLEALWKFVPDIYIDSMGFSFTLPLFKYLVKSKVACYVHYPTISTDMLNVVSQSAASFNNSLTISNSQFLTRGKLLYYHLFAVLYGLFGRTSDVIMVNSSWTREHIITLWKRPAKTFLVYPPCNVTVFKDLKLKCTNPFKIVSIGQFRPEKDHQLQLKIFRTFLDSLKPKDVSKARLCLIGGCRHQEDEQRVKELRQLCEDLNIERNVEFKLNLPFNELLNEMEEANIGLHTMKNEHFGIVLVECLAAGLLTVAHKSGGPKMDIVNSESNGYLADNLEEFSDYLCKIVSMSKNKVEKMRLEARESVERFSESEFDYRFISAIELVLKH